MQLMNMVVIIGCYIIGFCLLTGKDEWIMKDRNMAHRNEMYDMKKAGRVFGIALLIIGTACIITEMFPSQISNAIYLAVVLVSFGGSVFYMRTYCKRK